ncbi:MAG: DUF6382 domain-containing protein [Lachnospiraceae bacterium]|nr:DUF6382 domain-containing protein [Lachnospiraceae bacterium]
MDVTYQRDMNRNYMILHCDGGLDEESFETRMIFTNKIPGLLSCHVRYEDDRTYLGYDVTSRQSLALFCENRKLGKKELRNILGSILHTISGLDEYLLAPDHLVLDSKLIMMNFDSQEVSLAFAPFYKKDIRASLKELTECLLSFVSRDDQEGIVLCYRFSHELQEGNSGIAELMDVLHGTNLGPKGNPHASVGPGSGGGQVQQATGGQGRLDGSGQVRPDDGLMNRQDGSGQARMDGGWNGRQDGGWQDRMDGGGQSWQDGGIRESLMEKEEGLWDEDEGRHGRDGTLWGRGSRQAGASLGRGKSQIRKGIVQGQEGASHGRGKSVRIMAAVLVIGFILACAAYCGIHFLPAAFPESRGIALRIVGAVAICAAAVGVAIFLRKRGDGSGSLDGGAVRRFGRKARLGGVKDGDDEFFPEDEIPGDAMGAFAEKDLMDQDGEVMRELEDAIEAAGIWNGDGCDAFVPEEPVMGDGMTMLLTEEGKGGGAGMLVPGDAKSGLPIVPLSDGEVLIGKQQGLATHVISSPAVSRMHARVRCGEDGYYLRDLNSTNGTFVNDKPVFGEEEVRLEDGDRVLLADAAYIFRRDNAGRHAGVHEAQAM